jgi:hypothetical protein
MGLLEKIRRWVDGDDSENALEKAAIQAGPRRQSEEFIIKLARAVEDVMQREMVPLPQGTTLIPTEYIIFLSEDDDREWQGVKRRGLEQGLQHVLAERARELSGKSKLAAQSFALELRVDGTLQKGEIVVQHSWDESSNKTNVTPRGKPQQPQQQPVQTSYPQPTQQYQGLNVPPAPVNNPNLIQTIAAQAENLASDESEATVVKKRVSELYKLEVWHNGVRQNVIPVFQPEISVGRKSKSVPVDIGLEGDPEISRPHIIINRDPDGRFWITHKGRNPTIVSDREIPAGVKVPLNPGENIILCSYLLRIQPSA